MPSTKEEKCGLCGHNTPCPHSRLDKLVSSPKSIDKYLEEFEMLFGKRLMDDSLHANMRLDENLSRRNAYIQAEKELLSIKQHLKSSLLSHAQEVRKEVLEEVAQASNQ